MKKNARIYIWLETDLKDKLINEAKDKNISLCELCRSKLKDDSQLERIESVLLSIEKENIIVKERIVDIKRQLNKVFELVDNAINTGKILSRI